MAIDRTRGTSDYLPLRDAINRLFEGSFITPQVFSAQVGFPTVNLFTSDDDVLVEMAIPGATPDDLNISVTGDTVTVSGEVKRRQENQKGQPFFQEIFEGRFQRSFTLPIEVDADKAEASFEHGILTLRLPKSEATKPRRIQVGRRQSGIEGQTQQQSGETVERETIHVAGSQPS